MKNAILFESMYNFEGETAEIYWNLITGKTIVLYVKYGKTWKSDLSPDRVVNFLYNHGWIF